MEQTIRIIHKDGQVSLRTYAFSQVVKLLDGVPREDRRRFDAGEAIDAPIGNMKVVDIYKLKALSKKV
jgi:hypothetical protein